MNGFDRAVELAILVGVWVGCWMEWKTLQEKTKQRIKRQVTAVLKSLGIIVGSRR